MILVWVVRCNGWFISLRPSLVSDCVRSVEMSIYQSGLIVYACYYIKLVVSSLLGVKSIGVLKIVSQIKNKVMK